MFKVTGVKMYKSSYFGSTSVTQIVTATHRELLIMNPDGAPKTRSYVTGENLENHQKVGIFTRFSDHRLL